ncbi:dihydroneopterin aldolase [Pseudaestuariivita atlantica]|uniref:dihydroneopterin aldolase n=1 Tax=Pseudaestuariivita atlantica TaxID=1317121 RepID=A0A0L1JUS4_9RHOB|nr:dihydroneopterin aldolase [Pseudaestuariivita atlantica]KNG95505.1 diguanylate cyclase [Pseudaestuariivita atlantica]
MSHDIHLAFEHPAERARATEGTGLPDRISLRDHVVEVEIGAFQAERGTTQRVCFNVVVEVAPRDAVDDDVDTILSYDRVTEAIAQELAAERLNLLETLAERVAERVLLEPQALRAFVRIEKLDRGPGALGVEIVRARAADPVPDEHAVVHPHVVFLGNDAFDDPALAGWLDRAEAQAVPLVLCVGAPAIAPPKAAHPLAQRRIDLLAVEQNAWCLAARDARCVVVDTRTELDWAMKNGQISVWAPSKLVLDAVEKPASDVPEALAVWLADVLDAERMSFVAAAPPEGGTRPVVVVQRFADLD